MTRTALALALAIAVTPAFAGAQQDTTRQQQDTTRRQQQDTTRRRAPSVRTTETRGGEVASPRGRVTRTRANNYGLDRDQIRQLQQAINDRTECDAGTADGIIGPRTRRAMTCARRELNVQGNDMTELFTALNLNFDDADQPAAGRDSTMQNPAGTRDTTLRGTQRRDSTQRRDTTMRRDTTRRDTTQRDTTRGQQPPE
jgi:Ni/Co efflux regulator RcnB